MKKFIEFFLSNNRAVILLFVGFALLGYSSYGSLKSELFPDASQPFVTITSQYQGAAPAEIESLITRKIEDSIAGTKYLDEMTSVSGDGMSIVNVQFKLEADRKEVLQDVKDKVDQIKKDLPINVDGTPVVPIIVELDPTDAPVLVCTINGPNAVAVSDYLDDVLQPELESIDGVASVNLIGNKIHQIRIFVDPIKLAAYQINVSAIAQTLRSENVNLPGGYFDTKSNEYSLRILGQGKTPEEIGNILIPLPYQGVSIPLKNIAVVKADFQEQRQLSYLNGKEAVAFTVLRQPDANISDVADKVKKKLEQTKFPEGFSFKVVSDQGKFINSSKQASEDALMIGAVLATLVVLLFSKSFRAMIIAGVAMPLSVIGTYFIMLKLGLSLNILTLLALALIVGILVDDAIVALENALRHKEMYKEDNYTSALNGTVEIFWAMFATTLTIIAVFASIASMEGMAGRFFYSFGITVVSAVAISLLVAFTLTPIMCRYMLPTGDKRLIPDFHILEYIKKFYATVLGVTLKHPLITVLVTLIVVIACFKQLLPMIPKGFTTPIDNGEINIAVEMDPGVNLKALHAKTTEIEEIVRKYHPNETVSVMTSLGTRSGAINRANMGVTFVDKSQRKLTLEQLKGKLRNELKEVKDITFRIDDAGGADPSSNARNTPIAINLVGDDLTTLRDLSNDIADKLSHVKGIVDVDTSYGPGKPEYRISVNKKAAAELGVSTSAVVQALVISTVGTKVAQYSWSDDKLIDVWVMTNPDEVTLESILNTPVQNQNKTNVPLSAVVNVTKDSGPNSITRKDRHRRVLVFANIDNTKISLGQAQEAVAKVMKETKLPEGYSMGLVGQTQRMKEFFASFGMAFVTAVILIYIVLAIQYNSFLHPITVMVSMPLALTGAFAALAFSHTIMGIAALIGFVLLIGLVNKNSILLVDFALQKEKQGLSTIDAMVEAVKLRIRPVLMTTTAMIGGMAPIAMGLGAGSEFRYPMGVVVIGGLISSTIFTLIIVPTIFVLFDNMKHTVLKVLKGDPEALPDNEIKLPNGRTINIKTRPITFGVLVFLGAYIFISIVIAIVVKIFGGITNISPFLAGLVVAVPMVILMNLWVTFLRVKILMLPNLFRILPIKVMPIFIGSMALIAYTALVIILSLWGLLHGTNLGLLRLMLAIIMPVIMMSSAIILAKKLIHPHINEQK